VEALHGLCHGGGCSAAELCLHNATQLLSREAWLHIPPAARPGIPVADPHAVRSAVPARDERDARQGLPALHVLRRRTYL
jgi:hypothetical protein